MSIAVSKKVGTVFQKVLPLSNGRTIPQVGLGCYGIKEQSSIESALDAGYMHFDTAGFYKNEKMVGSEIRDASFMRATPRQEYFVCSKIPPGFATYKKAPTIIQSSVRSVGLEFLDCMLLLWPGTQKADEDDPINIENRHGCWKALEEAVDQKQIAGAGVSNFQVRHLE